MLLLPRCMSITDCRTISLYTIPTGRARSFLPLCVARRSFVLTSCMPWYFSRPYTGQYLEISGKVYAMTRSPSVWSVVFGKRGWVTRRSDGLRCHSATGIYSVAVDRLLMHSQGSTAVDLFFDTTWMDHSDAEAKTSLPSEPTNLYHNRLGKLNIRTTGQGFCYLDLLVVSLAAYSRETFAIPDGTKNKPVNTSPTLLYESERVGKPFGHAG
ncbi:hypothetical protein BC628DRAFT_1370845 [Trametes gibbosa]|nr:hypothetical protein BC628DRAFT_1370845 [Trametes gibbosa]